MTREYRINHQIDAKRVNLVLTDGTMMEGVPFSEALEIAENEDLDLIEVSVAKGNNLSVCKMADYGKMKYQQSKRDKSNRQVQHTKEIKYGFNISDHDLGVRHRKVEEFLSKHYIIRYILELKGREKYRSEEGLHKINKNLVEFEDLATWKPPCISYGGKKVVISTTLQSK